MTKLANTDNAIYIKEFKTIKFDLRFLTMLMEYADFATNANKSAQPKITQKPLEDFNYIVPEMNLQKDFSRFAETIDKSKFIDHSKYFLCESLTFVSSTMA